MTRVYRSGVGRSSLVGIVALVLGCGSDDSERESLESELESLESELESLESELDDLESLLEEVDALGRKATGKRARSKKQQQEVEELEAQIAEQEKKKQLIDTLKAKKDGPVRMLDEIAKATPETLRLLSLDEHKGQIVLLGQAPSNDVVAEFAHQLEQSAYFDDVYINASEQTMVDGVKIKQFSIEARLVVVHSGAGLSDRGHALPREMSAQELDAIIADQATYQYDPYGKRDPYTPFLTLIGGTEEGGPQTALQRYELSEYTVVAALTEVAHPKAMVQDPSGNTHVVELGTYIGKNWAQVSEITRVGIVVREEFETSDGELLVTKKTLPLRGGLLPAD